MTSLAPFVPRLALELAHEASSPSANIATRVPGSMLSADISGFTALSERLAGKGKSGAEQITDLINQCFSSMIDAAYEYGAEVLKFGGDALLILFRGHDHERRCAAAGLAMQAALSESSAAKRASLTMTVGAAEGPFHVFVVGSTYRELLITGPAASEVIRLEASAGSGETLVSDAIAAACGPVEIVANHDAGAVIAGAVGIEPTGPVLGELIETDPRPFVPAPVAEQLAAFAELGGEHRLVTVGFVMVKGIADRLEAVGPHGLADDLAELVDAIVAATDPVGVTALHTDIAPDGVKFVLCAGAPVSQGNTSDAMLHAALAIAATATPLDVRVGVQRGRVFAGFLGSDYRRTYTLMGDPVNTAARMLGKAERGEVVAVAEVLDDTRSMYHTTELEPFLVKGKSEPIVAHRVLAVTQTARRGPSVAGFVGRSDERAIVREALVVAGRVVEITGTAGVGKSHLIDAVLRDGVPGRLVRGTCSQYNSFTPYSVFRPALRTLFGLGHDDGPDEVGRRIKSLVERAAPELLPLWPLLAIPLGSDVESTPEVDAIDAEFRRFRMHETLVAFIEAVAPGNLTLLVEDVHWIDAASGDLLSHLIEAAAKRDWTMLLTRRPGGGWTLDPALEHVTTIVLEALRDDEIKQLAIDASTRPLRDTELELVVDRSEGNPLFVIELATAVSAGRSELPGTVEELIGDRIDDLEPQARFLVRIASVLGPTFRLEDLDVVARQAADDLDVEALQNADGLIEASADGVYHFSHGLYHEAAYEGLPYKRRRSLHQMVGEHLEELGPGSGISDPIVLSMHFDRAHDHERSWRYGRVAGTQSLRQGATVEAAVAFDRAQQASRHLHGLTDEDRFAVNEQLGDAWYLAGDFDQAMKGFKRARRYAADTVGLVRLMQKEGDLRERTGNSAQAMRWYNRSLRLIPDDTTDAELLHARSSIYLAQAGVRHRQTNHLECARLATRALIDATKKSDRPVIARAHERLGLAYTYLRDSRSRHHGDRAKGMYEELGDLRSVARVLGTQGIDAHFAGDWLTAAQRYREASEAAIRTGDSIEARIGQNNLAEVLSEQGHWSEAIEIFEDLLRVWTASAFAIGIGVAKGNLGYAYGRSGSVDPAIELLVEAERDFASLGASDFVQEMQLRLAEIYLRAGRDGDAGAVLAQLRSDLPDEPDDSDATKAVSRVLRMQAVLAHRSGDGSGVEELLIDSLVMAIAAGDDFLAALAHCELANIGVDVDHHEHQAVAIFSDLGVAQVAELLERG